MRWGKVLTWARMELLPELPQQQGQVNLQALAGVGRIF